MRRITLILLMLLVASPVLAQETLTIHYHRFDDAYSAWGLHLWGAIEWADGGVFFIEGNEYNWQNPMPYSGTDDYGVYWTVPIFYPEAELGFIVHNGDNKDPDGDRVWSDYTNYPEIWLLSGFTEIFTEEPNPNVRLMSATSNGANSIELLLATSASELDAFTVTKNGVDEPIASVGAQDTHVFLTMTNPLDITQSYEVQDAVGENAVPVRHEFDADDFVYNGEDLGFTYSPEATTFKLWSPVCSAANVIVYDNPYTVPDEPTTVVPMERIGVDGTAGVMEATVPGDLNGKFYLFQVTVFGETYTTPDLYSLALSANSERSMVFAPGSADPAGWDTDTYPTFDTLESVVYELHVRDVTTDDTWTGTEANRHKFLGVSETGTTWDGHPTGIDHIIDLGINTVQILPMYDFSSVDENNPNSRNWGYDPYAYNVPEGGYASNPNDLSRITEMKQMIMELHERGIKVIMDVVYNHTHNTGRASLYDSMVPKYYYRLNPDGSYANGSGVGNEIATEQPMAHNFILQSCKYWVEEFHIDGFRFDLMGLIDTDLMAEITTEVKAINPHAVVYGEPWGGYGGTILTGKGDQRGLGFGCFNDNIRNAIRGSTDGTDPGYAMGDVIDLNAVTMGIDGSIRDFTDGPTETINYISAHDNYTWWDKLIRWNTLNTPPANYPDSELVRMNQFGISQVFLSQGIAFMHAGSEFLRTKRTGDPDQDEETVRNSYSANDEVNKLDWQRRSDNDAVVQYYKGLITLRKGRPEFRLADAEAISTNLHYLSNVPSNAIAYTIDDVSAGDDWGDILVVHNPNNQAIDISLPEGDWVVVVDENEAGLTMVSDGPSRYVSTGAGTATLPVPNRSTMVLYQQGQPDVQLNIFQNPSLDQYLQFAVNALDENVSDVALTVNGTELILEELTAGSWVSSYAMAADGVLSIQLESSTAALTRLVKVGGFDAGGGTISSLDGAAVLNIPAGLTLEQRFLAVFDRGGQEYLFGNSASTLAGSAVIGIEPIAEAGDPEQLAVYHLQDGQWQELPSRIEEGRVVADTEKLGHFKLGPRTIPEYNTRLLGNFPNPFNPSTTIKFDLSAADASAPVKLEIYNLRGGLVRTVYQGHLNAGPHAMIWQGQDNAGLQTASGIYLYRLQSASGAHSGRMLMIK